MLEIFIFTKTVYLHYAPFYFFTILFDCLQSPWGTFDKKLASYNYGILECMQFTRQFLSINH